MERLVRRAIVTGASRGLGRAIAKALVREGFHVMALSRSEKDLLSLKEELLGQRGEIHISPVDITREEEVCQCMVNAKKALGGVDILINNAAFHASLPLEEMSLELFEKTVAVNLTGSFLLIREALPLMKRERRGAIINLSSSAAHTFFPGFGAYAASKGGLNSLTMVLAGEVRDSNIHVFALDLGLINTERTRSRIEEGDPKDWLQEEEVVEVILFLLSKAGEPLRGSVIPLYGKRK